MITSRLYFVNCKSVVELKDVLAIIFQLRSRCNVTLLIKLLSTIVILFRAAKFLFSHGRLWRISANEIVKPRSSQVVWIKSNEISLIISNIS